MTNAQAIILGTVQGLTEYLPVSSSAHLVLLPHVMGWHFVPKEAFIFDILVQLGTSFGVIFYFFASLWQVAKSVLHGLVIRKPWHDDSARLGWMVVLASIPAAILGFTFKEQLSIYFSSPLASCYFLLFTGVFLLLAEYGGRSIKHSPSRRDALVIGCAQSFALFPGISRSGATIAAGMACGLARAHAARFSFLMSLPIMVGAAMVALVDLINDIALFSTMLLPLTLGFLSAAITGYFVIKWFMTFLTHQRLTWFSGYCFTVGIVGIFYFTRF